MNFATLQRIIFHNDAEADAFVAEHGPNAAAKVEPRTVRLLRPFKLVPMSADEAAEWNKPGIASRSIIPFFERSDLAGFRAAEAAAHGTKGGRPMGELAGFALLPLLLLLSVICCAGLSAGAALLGLPPWSPSLRGDALGATAANFVAFHALPLAQSLPMPPMDDIGLWVWRMIGVCLLGTVLLTFWEKLEARFRRKPPIDDDLKALQKALTGFAPKEVVDKIVEQIEKSASKEDLATVLALITDKERDLQQQVKDVRGYAHDEAHHTRNDLGSRITNLESGEKSGAAEQWSVINGLRIAIADIQTDLASINETRQANRELLAEMNREVVANGKQLAGLAAVLEKYCREGGGR